MIPITRSVIESRSRGVPFLSVAINSQSVDELVAAGLYREAARAASSAGDHSRAAELFERIWDFAAAAREAQDAGDLGRALRSAIDARDDAMIAEMIAALEASGAAGIVTAVDVLSRRRRFADAARLAEAAGERDRAIQLYQAGQLDMEAARLLFA